MTDPTYPQLVATVADLREQLAAVTAERDRLQEQIDTDDYNRRAQLRLRRLGLRKYTDGRDP